MAKRKFDAAEAARIVASGHSPTAHAIHERNGELDTDEAHEHAWHLRQVAGQFVHQLAHSYADDGYEEPLADAVESLAAALLVAAGEHPDWASLWGRTLLADRAAKHFPGADAKLMDNARMILAELPLLAGGEGE